MKKFLVPVLFVGTVIFSLVFTAENLSEKKLAVSFLDVGQGDAIFIQTPNGAQILIDGGPSHKVVEELDGRMPFFDTSIDIVIATHPDLDHIGGLVDVLKKFDVSLFLESGNESGSPAQSMLRDLLEEKGIKNEIVRRGDVYDFNDGAQLRILFPYKDVSGIDPNDASIVAKLVYGEHSFILTGDAPISTELALVGSDKDELKTTVLKLGHHGSDTSTSDSFLKIAKPTFGVISAGKNNHYGHPHKSVLERAKKYSLQLFETSKQGTIIFSTNGKEIKVLSSS